MKAAWAFGMSALVIPVLVWWLTVGVDRLPIWPSAAPEPPEVADELEPEGIAEAWTVCVWCDFGDRDPRGHAERMALRLEAEGFEAEVLYSSRYPGLEPEYWITVSGRFEGREAARIHEEALRQAGFFTAIRILKEG
jgi:hypothetical protein